MKTWSESDEDSNDIQPRADVDVRARATVRIRACTGDPKLVALVGAEEGSCRSGISQFAITQRIEILSQIDPKFAKLSSNKKNTYLWRAETANLPSAPVPKLVFKWNTDDPNCAADFSYEGKLTRKVEAAGFEVHATLEDYLKGYGFLKFHLRIENHTQAPQKL